MFKSLLVLIVLAMPLGAAESTGWFTRGDANNDGAVTLTTDWVYLHDYLFGSGPAPVELDAADVNDDGVLDLSDMIALQNWFMGTFAISAPYPDPGDDTTGDYLANDTSPFPGGDGATPDVTDEEPIVFGVDDFDRWNISSNATLGDGGHGVRILESRNVICNGDEKDQLDWWVSIHSVDKSGMGHATTKALLSPKQNGQRDVSIKLSVELRTVIKIDCLCFTPWEDIGANTAIARFGYGPEDAQIKVILESFDEELLVLGKDRGEALFHQQVQTVGYNECTGDGWAEETTTINLTFDGDDIVGSGVILPEDILRVAEVDIDGIVHLSMSKISEKRTGDELSRYEEVETHVGVSVEYDWR